MPIIAICGFQSSGKDTIAEYLISNYNYKKLSFASVLKDIIAIIFDWSRDKLEGLTKEDRAWREEIDEWWANALNMPNLSPRYVLQYFGTELFRVHWHQDIWLKVIEKKLMNYENIVITDCRFPNEIEMLNKYGAKFIHIHRKMPEWFEKYQQGEFVEEAEKLHQSEKEWIRCNPDYVINNNGSLDELYEQVNKLLYNNYINGK